MRYIVFAFLAVILSAEMQAQKTKASLRGSRSSMEKQNAVADRENLTRLKNSEKIEKFKKMGLLVPIPNGTNGLIIDNRLDTDRRVCRTWTVKFLKDLGTRFVKKFDRPLRVNSCVRDVETQANLRGSNANAASTHGPRASAHLTGAAVDIARIGLSKAEQDFIRARLLANEKRGLIEATEEKRQKVWHVMVYKEYVENSKK